MQNLREDLRRQTSSQFTEQMRQLRNEARELTHERWVVNKLRALGSWYTKGLENGSHLRTGINSAPTLGALRDLIVAFFGVGLSIELVD